jgi:hypothetical protein
VSNNIHLTSKLVLNRLKSLDILSHNTPCHLSPEFADDSHLRRYEVKYENIVELNELHLRIPSRIRELKMENFVVNQIGSIESSIHTCTQLVNLELIKVYCEQISLRDLYYLKIASFDLGRFSNIVQLANCPNLEVLKIKNLAKIPAPGSGSLGISPINKLKEVHYDILQNQDEYLNNDQDPI